MGLASMLAFAASPVAIVFRATRRPTVRAVAIAVVASPLCTLLLGILISEIFFESGRGLNPRVFSEFFVGASLLLFFVGFWVLGHRFLERRAAKATPSAATRRSAT